MKQKLLSVTVASVLGLGIAEYAQAQEQEGCKAYVLAQVIDLRLVNRESGNVVLQTGLGAQGNGFTLGTFANVPASVGIWNSVFDDFDAQQSCIGFDAGLGNLRDYQTGGGAFPGCPDVLFPGGNSFDQVGSPDGPPPYEDFGRGDILVIPSTGPDDLGDDIFHLAGCQVPLPNPPVPGGFNATGSAASQSPAFPFTVDQSTQFLDNLGEYGVRAEALISPNAAPNSAVQATSAVSFEIERQSDGATLNCNTDAISADAELIGPGNENVPIPEGPLPFGVVCDAADFGTGAETFEPDDEYEVTADFTALASCNCLPGPGDGYKSYLAKRTTSPRLPNPIVSDLVITDQFGTQTVDVRQLVELINPARKNAAGLPDFTDHLTCYNLARQSAEVIVPGNVRITTDNFGEEDVRLTRGPKELCGPALKNGVGDLNNPYYTCYVANGGQNQGDITVSDQFFDQREHELTKMSRVCTPAGLNGAPPPPPTDDDHLACYEFASQPRLPRQDPFLPTVDDAFMPDPGVTVTVEYEQRWCEAATKERL